ncbi:Phytochrome-like protein cph2 [Pseudomonas sp. THAF187a]|uniref:sensor domain-containing diguanylate cyclase n=1 Tax=unclassified Pseudomonas TaxID=196821 RepID=UPI00055FCE1B|nr:MULTISPECIES: diguanylate cyclase [unclassified Pseudomonas]QFT20274.1 Phytochrome-like protein cph2 [Pseudomonas sp. THAF187a]QFT40465.1 Phytochrome-like protein cph2 [Pseudomonas sp. THAF42]
MPASSAWPARLALAFLLLVLSGASVLLWRQIEGVQQQRLDERVGYQARSLARQLEGTLHLEVASLERIARLWNSLGRLPRASWDDEVERALRGFPAYQSIQWVGDDLRMRWLFPVAGNEAALNFRLLPSHPNYPLAMEARDTGEQRFSNSFDLVQGGRGFVLYTPLYRQQDGQRVFDGFLQGVFRVEPLMVQLLTQIDRDAFNLELLENGQVLFRHGDTTGDDPHSLQLGLSLLNNQAFSLRLSPTARLLEQLDSPLPGVVLGASLAISLLLVAALALALENSRRAHALQLANRRYKVEAERREETEQRLRENRERLQLVLDLTDSSHDGLFIFDSSSRELLHMNQATYATLGYRPEQFAELLREDPEKLLPGFHRWLQQVREAQRDNLSRIFQRELIRRDGSRQPAEINTQLVELHGREYLIAVSRDNSERLQLEDRLQRLSQQDGLTGLYNRRYFDQRLQAELRRLRRAGAPLTLLLLDIDHFKAYNDALGHLAGDDALRKVSAVLQDSLQREGDAACRYGGEEFAIILAGTGLEGGEHVAARIHAGIAALELPHPASPLERLSLSIGLAVLDPVRDEQPGELIARCDQALYSAKHEGRNRTCLWGAALA